MQTYLEEQPCENREDGYLERQGKWPQKRVNPADTLILDS